MKIGLDFDNTLVRYDRVFASESQKQGMVPLGWSGTKKELRDELRTRPDGERLWQKLQGRVYGLCMDQASLYPGVAQFLLRSRYRGDDLYIVSHKTEFGHFDATNTSLRKAALDWMESKGFFDKNGFGLLHDRVFFAASRKEKVDRIAGLDLEIFIDDLEEVFAEEGFPPIRKVLFSRNADGTQHDVLFDNWNEIGEEVLGPMTEEENMALTQTICEEKIEEVTQLAGNGNSRVYRIKTLTGRAYALKYYPDLLADPRPRLQNEVRAFRILEDLQMTPKTIAHDKDLNLALYEWIKGKHPKVIENSDLNQALVFIEKLKELHKKSLSDFSLASEACLSASELYYQLEGRIRKLEMVQNLKLQRFLENIFKPLFEKVRKWSESKWPLSNFKKELPISRQTLSPSDFGFHNALQRSDGSLCFLDLEYFGRDDPVKLIADFLWHPAMELDWAFKNRWLESMFEIFKEDPEIQSRFYASWPLYGLRWILILLNEFSHEGWQKRVHANLNLRKEREQKLELQLQKALKISMQIQDQNMLCPYIVKAG